MQNSKIICVFCGMECEPDPTERGWASVRNEGLHFDCASKVVAQQKAIDDIEKEKIFFMVEDNADESCTVRKIIDSSSILMGWMEEITPAFLKKNLKNGDELFFTITPVLMTEQEYQDLPDA